MAGLHTGPGSFGWVGGIVAHVYKSGSIGTVGNAAAVAELHTGPLDLPGWAMAQSDIDIRVGGRARSVASDMAGNARGVSGEAIRASPPGDCGGGDRAACCCSRS